MDISKLNLYEILNVDKNSTNEDINNSYQFCIKKYKFLPFLTQNQKNDIKKLNIAKYILTNTEKRNIYDRKFLNIQDKSKFENEDKKINSTAICDRIFSL